jgi:hypothetical protein
MYSITGNIYYSQLSSVAILLQPDLTVSHRIIQGNDSVSSPSVLSSFVLPLPPTCVLVTVSEARIIYVHYKYYRSGEDKHRYFMIYFSPVKDSFLYKSQSSNPIIINYEQAVKSGWMKFCEPWAYIVCSCSSNVPTVATTCISWACYSTDHIVAAICESPDLVPVMFLLLLRPISPEPVTVPIILLLRSVNLLILFQ